MASPYWFCGTHLRLLVDEYQTGSGYDLIEGRFPPGVETYRQTRYDELICVPEGNFTVYTNTGKATLAPGESIFIPRNTPHVVMSTGEDANQALTIASPGGFGQLIRRVGIPDLYEGIPPGQANDLGLFVEWAHEIGDVIIGAPGARPVRKK